MLPLVQGTGATLGLCQKSNSTRKMTFAGQALCFCSAKATGDGRHPWEEAATVAQEQAHRWSRPLMHSQTGTANSCFSTGDLLPRKRPAWEIRQSGYLKLDGALRN